MVIDAHQHFWTADADKYPWMTGDYAPLFRTYTPDDLTPLLHANGVDGTVLVQTWSNLEETKHFLALAEATPFIKGVVGWVDLTDASVDQVLEELTQSDSGRYLVGIRHQVHDEADPDWLLRDDVQRGLAALEAHNLAFDLLIRSRELPAAIETVENFPNLRFVIDHIAKPEIRHNTLEPWHSGMEQLGKHKHHVWCKLSGMFTEANWQQWQYEDMLPYIEKVLAMFGSERCLYGSDWPVSTLAADYSDTLAIIEKATENYSEVEKQKIFGGNAMQAYLLPMA